MKPSIFSSLVLLIALNGCSSEDKTPKTAGASPTAALISNTQLDAPKENQMLSAPSAENIMEALKETGIHIYNINLPQLDLEKYQLVIYRDTYLNGVKSTHPAYPMYTGLKANSRTTVQNQYNLVLTLIDKSDSLFKESWQLPTGNRSTLTSKKDKQHFLDFNVTPFKSQEIVPDKKIPILVYGSSWKEEKTGYLRYCMEPELEPNFSNEAFDKMPGYYIYSIELKTIR